VPKTWPPRTRTSGEFERCATAADVEPGSRFIPTTRLDARLPDQLAAITSRQKRVVEVAVLRKRFVALLDVPNGVPSPTLLRWRADFDTSYAAAYHPWLGVPREDDPARTLVDVPPSAFAAGVIAARERRYGLPWGPANELAVGAVAATASVSDAMHDQLHLAGINVFRVERDGFRLSAARTLSSDADYRQLSIRRLMTMLALTLERQGQWLVFEPNTAALRRDLTFSITQLLRELQRAGAFAGATDAESFFVTCDDALNPRASQELGRLVAEVGVAPAAPLEYLVLRITQDSSGRVQVSPRGGVA
jgi:phage tail sheath protein FI